MKGLLHRSQFLKEIREAFPQLRAEINRQYGLLHLEVHAFTDLTQSFIDRNDESAFCVAIRIADRYLQNGNATLRTALFVSFLEHLNFRNDATTGRSWAWDFMPPVMKEDYLGLQEEMAESMTPRHARNQKAKTAAGSRSAREGRLHIPRKRSRSC
jgi:hypothetical protein